MGSKTSSTGYSCASNRRGVYWYLYGGGAARRHGHKQTVLTLFIQRGPDHGYVLQVEHLAAPLRIDGTLLRLGPTPRIDKSAAGFRRITAARTVAENAESELEAAVRAARANGDSWEAIGAALGTSARTARERFRH